MPDPTDIADQPTPSAKAFEQVLKVAFELHNAGRSAEAEAMCRVLLRTYDRDAQLLFLLGMVLHKLGRAGEGLKYLESAALLEPKSARIFNGLGFVYQSLHDHERALEEYEQAVKLGFKSADTYYSMGNACHQLGEVEKATEWFKRAVELKPEDVASWNNFGKCLAECGRLEESIQAYDRAVALDPDYTLARYGRALSLLTAGRLPEGFREYNESRFYGIQRREFPQPAWAGEEIAGKTLFLHAEQGYGDAIQHVRFVRQARERAGRVILECRPELKTLLEHSGCADVVIEYGEEIPLFDVFTSLVSLPGILGVTLETIPHEVPYLKAPLGVALPSAPAGNLKVGLAWAGNPTHHNDLARSIRLEEMIHLLAVPGVTFCNLQKIMPAHDDACVRARAKLVNPGGLPEDVLKDFLATAGVIAQLDLVIAVDTAVVHLAGALAKPVWTLLPFSADWRWFQDRTETPWYPTMRLFRQEERNQWEPVLERVAKELAGKR
jgi:tetratricopeptide (TPR) repeat protein